MLLAALLTGMVAKGPHPDYVVFPALTGLVLVIYLVRDIRQSEKNLNFFFDAVDSNDSTVTFPESGSNPFMRNLHRQMNRINQTIHRIRVTAEARELYYREVIRHSATGLVVISSDEEIEMINEAAANFAGISATSTDHRLLKIQNPPFYQILCQIQAGGNFSVRTKHSESEQTLLFRAREIHAGEKPLKLVSIENIRRELDEKELESYQNLIRILTHEIMNSVAPLTSISRTLQKLFYHEGRPVQPEAVNGEMIETTVKGLTTIDEQGKGLVNFVNSYRKLVRLPKPMIEPFDAKEWTEQLKLLVSEQLMARDIVFEIIKGAGVKTVTADKNLINQVVLNLINNAADALLEIPSCRRILLRLQHAGLSMLLISVSNNGPQIPDDILGKIFIPFFTTKKEGSGIGLALSRQILYLHKGILSVSSTPEETRFTLELPVQNSM